jgi:hypothetical protein
VAVDGVDGGVVDVGLHDVAVVGDLLGVVRCTSSKSLII